ncbi:MAG: VWA domain-containing protein, partial [Victivallaceae bacterium]
MNFIDTSFFYWAILLIPLTVAVFYAAALRRRKLMARLLGSRANDPAFATVSLSKRNIRFLLLLVAFLLLLVAAARPWWGTRAIPYTANSRDVLVLFDVSKSMLATDVAPSRLKHAQYLLSELIRNNRGDRFGLVAFAGDAYLECPLTGDKTSLMQYVDELSPETVPLGGTNLERALNVAAAAFEAAEGNFRAVVLITDGDELDGNSRQAVEALKKKHIPLLVIGLGDPAVPALVPEPDGSFKRDAGGELVKTRLAEKELRELALSTGGLYVRSTAGDSGLSALESRIKSLIPAETSGGMRSVPIERFPGFLAAALVLLLGFFLISERRLAAVLLVCCALAAQAEPLAKEPSAKDAKAPAKSAAPAVQKAEELYNQALELQLQAKPEATANYEQAIQLAADRPEVRARSFFNHGADSHRQLRENIAKSLESLRGQQLDGANR